MPSQAHTLTEADRADFALMTGLEGRALEDWIDLNYPLTPKNWQLQS